jgi:hypothetical protein
MEFTKQGKVKIVPRTVYDVVLVEDYLGKPGRLPGRLIQANLHPDQIAQWKTNNVGLGLWDLETEEK